MEIISVSGYTPFEKLQIAKKFLLRKAVENNGLTDYPVKVSDKTLMQIVQGYTKESGVRGVERNINTIARKIATEVVSDGVKKGKSFNVTHAKMVKYLGPIRFDGTDIEETPQVGLVNGLAWTSVGGELLNIEVVTMPGKGQIQITGKLGDVMQESAKAALSYVRTISDRLGIGPEWYEKHDIHIHVPEGATPKDGPSAGVTMATALTSAITGIPVWQNVAMTGEITIRGRVLPIGGLKEKILAAKQAGVTKILIPHKNLKDLAEIPNEIKSGVEVIGCQHAEEVLRSALNLSNAEEFMKVVGLKVVESSGLPKAMSGMAN